MSSFRHFFSQNRLQILVFVSLFCVFLLTLKGTMGNGLSQAKTLTSQGQAFEDSIGRGRYALILSLVENHRTNLTREQAQFAAPDVATTKGKFISIFPPGTAFSLLPLYATGSVFSIGQLSVGIGEIILAIMNGILLYQLARKLQYSPAVSLIAPVTFLLASNAFVYAGVLGQHHLSTFLMLCSIHTLFMKQKSKAAGIVLFLYAISISVDIPNLVLLFPVVAVSLSQSLRSFAQNKQERWGTIAIALLALIPLSVYGIYTMRSGNSLLTIGQFLPRVTNISGNVVNKTIGDKTGLSHTFFLRKIPYGIYVLLFSRERGVLYFAPLFFLSIVSYFSLLKKQKQISLIFSSILMLNVLLYASFGDPWGGPSFGPRYLIPSFAILSIFLTEFIVYAVKNKILYSVFLLLGAISVVISSLGSITTTLIPVAKDAARLNIQFPVTVAFNVLKKGNLGSFIFSTFASRFITADFYFLIIVAISCSIFFYTIEKARRSMQ